MMAFQKSQGCMEIRHNPFELIGGKIIFPIHPKGYPQLHTKCHVDWDAMQQYIHNNVIAEKKYIMNLEIRHSSEEDIFYEIKNFYHDHVDKGRYKV
jgi:hypothetical protein